MKIRCVCGKTLKIPDSLAGKKVKCPSCGHVLSVDGDATRPAGGKQTVQCSCGQKLAVPADAMGKKVRCPACSAIVAIPADGAALLQAPYPEPEPSAEDLPFELDLGGQSSDAAISDDDAFEVAGAKCPNCGSSLDAAAQFCVACGTHMATGTKTGGVDLEELKDRTKSTRQFGLMLWGGVALVILAIVLTLAFVGFDRLPFVGKSSGSSSETSPGLPPPKGRGTEAQKLGPPPLEPRPGEGYIEKLVYAPGRTEARMNVMGAEQAIKAFEVDHERMPRSLDELQAEYPLPVLSDGLEYEYNPETGKIKIFRTRDRQPQAGEPE